MNRMAKCGLATVLAASVCFSASAFAGSYDMVVVRADGAAFKPGTMIDGNQTLTLQAGSKVTLVGADGGSITLHGPSTIKPVDMAKARQLDTRADSKVAEVIGALLSDQRRSTKALGVVRSATTASFEPPPNEWAVSVDRSGTRCIGADMAMLWRTDASHKGDFGHLSWLPDPRARRVQRSWSRMFSECISGR